MTSLADQIRAKFDEQHTHWTCHTALLAAFEIHKLQRQDNAWAKINGRPVNRCTGDGHEYPCATVRAIADALGINLSTASPGGSTSDRPDTA